MTTAYSMTSAKRGSLVGTVHTPIALLCPLFNMGFAKCVGTRARPVQLVALNVTPSFSDVTI